MAVMMKSTGKPGEYMNVTHVKAMIYAKRASSANSGPVYNSSYSLCKYFLLFRRSQVQPVSQSLATPYEKIY